jgi:hypothetical protein
MLVYVARPTPRRTRPRSVCLELSTIGTPCTSDHLSGLMVGRQVPSRIGVKTFIKTSDLGYCWLRVLYVESAGSGERRSGSRCSDLASRAFET